MSYWFVYILECLDGSLYTGSTNDLESRLEKHKSGKGAKYTKSRGVKKIVHTERFRTRSRALKREAEIKGYDREKKLSIIFSSPKLF